MSDASESAMATVEAAGGKVHRVYYNRLGMRVLLRPHSFPIDRYTTRPLVVEDGLAVAPDVPGTGVTFDWERLAEFEMH